MHQYTLHTLLSSLFLFGVHCTGRRTSLDGRLNRVPTPYNFYRTLPYSNQGKENISTNLAQSNSKPLGTDCSTIMETTIYRCVSGDCSKSYRRLSNLQAHLSMVISCFSGTHHPWNIDQILAQHDLSEVKDALEACTYSATGSHQASQRSTRSREANNTIPLNSEKQPPSSKTRHCGRKSKVPSLPPPNSLNMKPDTKEEAVGGAEVGKEESQDEEQEISMAALPSRLIPSVPAESQMLPPFVATVETRHDYHLVGNCQRLINLNNARTLEKLHQAVLQGLPAAPGMDTTWDVYALKVNVRRTKAIASDKEYEVGSEESWGLLFMLMKRLEDAAEVSIMARLRVKSTQG